MKKKYLSPDTQSINIKMQPMMAGSVNNTSGADGLGMGGDTSSGSITEGASRGGFWDDEA